MDETIHVNELFTTIVTGAVAVYIGSNIQKAIVRSQNDHEVLFDEIKRIITYLEKIEAWVDAKQVPFEEGKKFFKKATLAISYCQKIFIENHSIDDKDFVNALNQFNVLKEGILDISPTNDYIILSTEQADKFDQMYRDIRNELFKLSI